MSEVERTDLEGVATLTLNRPESLNVLSDRLASMKAVIPDIKVIVRADRRLAYDDVRAVMRIIAQHDIELLNVVAHVAETE